MDLLYPEPADACHSDSELSNSDYLEMNSSLKRHSHFFLPPVARSRPRSVPLLLPTDDGDRAASPMMTVLDDSSSERIDRVSLGTEGGGERDEIDRSGKEGIRFENRESLAHDLQFLANMPELCDTTFLVGGERQPICGVRAILAARSRVFRRLLFGDRGKSGKKKATPAKPPDGYIEKYDLRGHPVIVVTDFEPGVFKLLIDYIHTGSVMLQARSLLGLMNAADHYSLEDLKLACIRFMEHCITIDTVCSLLASAEKYIQYKSTKILVQKMFEFVDRNAEKILSLGAFQQLPQHVVRIVLGREELQAMEVTKFNAAYRWVLRYVEERQGETVKEVFEPFVDVINFAGIPARDLMQNVRKAEVVEDRVILNALATQADPSSATEVGRQGGRLRKTATVPSDIEGRSAATPSPQPARRERVIRRAQSSKSSLAHVTDTNGGASSPAEGWQRGGASVPSLVGVATETHLRENGTETRLRENGTETGQPVIQPPEASDTPPTASPASPRSQHSAAGDTDSTHDNSNRDSVSSFGMEGEPPVLTSSPVNFNNRQRQFLSYNTLDMIVTTSNPDNTPVNV